MAPNVIRTMATAPAALEGYLGLQRGLGGGLLSAPLREQIAVTVAQANGCDYCLAAHRAIAKTVGLSEEAIADARRGVVPDKKVEAALQFSRQLVEQRGWVGEDGLRRVRDAGYSEQEIVEIIANVAMNIFTNYLNHVAETEIDFPTVPELANT
jgi:uncharacterized peroxidase-related enzyme